MSNLEFLSDEKQRLLRRQGLLKETEIAAKRGDIVIAMGFDGKNERFLGYSQDLLKENKRILKG